ncbi:hypothetical protein [Inquilinus sp. Marseille-Q2685]|nr:hypothetical protein [Inquilinus sp. Marseille-Q2685]
MRRLGLLAALLAVAVAAAACERSDKPAKGVYMGAGGGVSVPS